MKNLKKFMMLLLALVLFTSGSCSDDEDFMLPTITQTGENTFGCYIDGKLFYPRDGTGTLDGFSGAKGLQLTGTGTGPNYISHDLDVGNFQGGRPINFFVLHVHDLAQNEEGEYLFKVSNFEDGIDSPGYTHLYVRAYDYRSGGFKWYGSTENSGSVIISKYDIDNRILSGTFSGILTEEGGTNTVEITDGRFDINWSTLPDTKFP
ncbi:hypothetical protein FF125_06515 [Aureibaculum algae]|uniref:Lipoprotein n=1 Tax=Aureibaculum algae TaxID=2584122 RepID=A0A5B7TT05_9FLAO|nr:hypothetical protein [Aureibaculum algae]QCX38097.1 hypothetical protein FF125_06515 [Aureibaculum algae]